MFRIKRKFINLPEESINLQKVINEKFAAKNFYDFLSFYGINSQTKSKSWNNILSFCFLIQFIKFFIAFFFDPSNDDYKLCIYLGDLTLLFESLRKYLLITIILVMAFAFHLNYLFNHNPNIEWFEIFKCFDGTLTPESIGIKEKKNLIIMLIITKISLKIIKFVSFGFMSLVLGLSFGLFVKKVHIDNQIELISVFVWTIGTVFTGIFQAGIIFTSNIFFQIVYYHCLINARYYNKMINFKSELSNGYKQFIVKLKILWMIKNQNRFAIRILKYNKFWNRFYLMMMLYIIPANIISVQQVCFGEIIFELKIILIISAIFGLSFILSPSLIVCLLEKEMRNHYKKLINLQ